MRPEIRKIVIDPDFGNAELPHKIAEKLSLKPEFVTKDELLDEIRRNPGEDLFKTAKKVLFFTENKGRFLKKCPGSKGVVCCNYYTINSVTGCPYDCSYCILQHYIGNNPFITVFLNKEKAIEEIVSFLAENCFLRVGTGELADSLALDHLLDESGFFIGELSKHSLFERVQFEFKTKSAEVERLLEVKDVYPDSNIVTGFSVNIPRFSSHEEPGTATLEERMTAAEQLQKKGVKVAIHFDPVLMLEELFDDYMQLIDSIFSRLDPEKIARISMGGFRHTLALTETIIERNPKSLLLRGEMFPSDSDNKLRYLAFVRRRFYTAFNERISRFFKGNPPLYMCMEKAFMWSDMKMPLPEEVFRNNK
ncbi:hypothetical protein II898_04145 [bacterium]|nr:hypothetical protein [bacterium]